jgi:hypothetical protein
MPRRQLIDAIIFISLADAFTPMLIFASFDAMAAIIFASADADYFSMPPYARCCHDDAFMPPLISPPC